MTTKCDIEELRHIAQQKFIELVESGAEFEREWMYSQTFRRDGWRAEFDGRPGRWLMVLSLSGNIVWQRSALHREAKETKSGTPDKRDAAKALKEYEAALEEMKSDQVAIAIDKIRAKAREADREAQCRRMQAALEESCESLKSALASEHPSRKRDGVFSTILRKIARQ